jgi:hypothetical protein
VVAAGALSNRRAAVGIAGGENKAKVGMVLFQFSIDRKDDIFLAFVGGTGDKYQAVVREMN